MAFTFKKTLEGVSIGKSLFDEDGSKKVESLIAKAKANNVNVVLPVDYVTGDKFGKDAKVCRVHCPSFFKSRFSGRKCNRQIWHP
jgi:phosphoglycerate kinase